MWLLTWRMTQKFYVKTNHKESTHRNLNKRKQTLRKMTNINALRGDHQSKTNCLLFRVLHNIANHSAYRMRSLRHTHHY